MEVIIKKFNENMSTGFEELSDVKAGDILSKEDLKLDTNDASIEIISGFGNLEISI